MLKNYKVFDVELDTIDVHLVLELYFSNLYFTSYFTNFFFIILLQQRLGSVADFWIFEDQLKEMISAKDGEKIEADFNSGEASGSHLDDSLQQQTTMTALGKVEKTTCIHFSLQYSQIILG